MKAVAWLAVLVVVAGSSAWGQSLQTEGNIETDGQLVSKAAQGTAPLEVSSTTKVNKLNADFLDGKNSQFFASATELQEALPDPPCFDFGHRFVNCNNGTVTDTMTGLIWLYEANCFDVPGDWSTANWGVATLLFDGATSDPAGGDCGLSDGSRPGDWRLPTKEEWEGILDPTCTTDPKIVGNLDLVLCYTDPLDDDAEWASGVVSSTYWSSTASGIEGGSAWSANLADGLGVFHDKANYNAYVWPVRGDRDRRITSISCPAGQFVTGISAEGDLICDSIPAP